MRTLEDQRDDELRALLRSDDAPTRVHAAWALAARLGARASGDLMLGAEPSSGVRRHWLTVLAGIGERDVVRLIAEAHDGDAEGEHATVLAMRIGAADKDWLAQRFAGGTKHLRAVLLQSHPDAVEWPRCLGAVADELSSPWRDVRDAAATILLDCEDGAREALRDAAVAHPDERADVFQRWAAGTQHRSMLDAKVLERAGEAVVAALLDAGRILTLDELRHAQVLEPSLLRLWDGKAKRLDVLRAVEDDIEHRGWLHTEWEGVLKRGAGEPFSADERSVLAGWVAASARWTSENEWAADFPEESPWSDALDAVGRST